MIHLLLIVLLAINPAQAKTKTAKARVAEVFKDLMAKDLIAMPRHAAIRQPPKALKGLTENDLEPYELPPVHRLRGLHQPPPYVADRPTFFAAGKLMIYRECEVELRQDPGEHSCRPVWAWL